MEDAVNTGLERIDARLLLEARLDKGISIARLMAPEPSIPLGTLFHRLPVGRAYCLRRARRFLGSPLLVGDPIRQRLAALVAAIDTAAYRRAEPPRNLGLCDAIRPRLVLRQFGFDPSAIERHTPELNPAMVDSSWRRSLLTKRVGTVRAYEVGHHTGTKQRSIALAQAEYLAHAEGKNGRI